MNRRMGESTGAYRRPRQTTDREAWKIIGIGIGIVGLAAVYFIVLLAWF